MSRVGDEDEVPPKFDDEGNPTNNEDGSMSGASTGPTLEDHIRRLEKLMTENNKLRAKAKDKKTKGNSFSSEEEDSSFEEEVYKKGKIGKKSGKDRKKKSLQGCLNFHETRYYSQSY
jgi:hypothetical protein